MYVVELQDALELACRLRDEHGLDGWRIELDRAKRRAGVCRHGSRTIGLSAALTELHDEAEVRETILHEIAHALAGPRHQHDATWRAIAISIGSNGERCVREDAPRVLGDWRGACGGGHEFDRHRRPERVLLCRRCDSGDTDARIIQWTYRGRFVTMHPSYTAELRRLMSSAPVTRLQVGQTARITSGGRWGGRVGVVEKVGRTRYHVRLPEGVLQVLFSAVEAGPAERVSPGS
ncbi:SprT-like domain-containing protein [Nocardioides zeicaulis]